MTWIEPESVTGHYVCDHCEKKMGLFNPVEIAWSAGHLSGGRHNFHNLQAMASFLRKNPIILEEANMSKIYVRNIIVSRWVAQLIMRNIKKMPKEVKEWDNSMGENCSKRRWR